MAPAKFDFRKVTKLDFLTKLKTISLYKWMAFVTIILLAVVIGVIVWYFTGRKHTSSSHMAPTAAPTEAPTAAPTEAPTAAPTEAPTAAPTRAQSTRPILLPVRNGANYIVRYKNKWNMFANPTENGNVEFTGNYSKFQFIKIDGPDMYKIKANGAYLTSDMTHNSPVTISGGTEDKALIFTVTRVTDNIINVSTTDRILSIQDGKLVTSPHGGSMIAGLGGIFGGGIGMVATPEGPSTPIELYVTESA